MRSKSVLRWSVLVLPVLVMIASSAMTEVGGPANTEVKTWIALNAPKGTPASMSAKVADALAKALAGPDVKETFTTFGFEPFISQPANITKQIEADDKRYSEIARRAKMAMV